MIDVHEAASRIQAANAQEREQLRLRRSEAQAFAREAAGRILALHPEAQKVWGFGSTFELWRNFRMTSDIDLAIESGDVVEIFPLVENREYPVDLVCLQDCPPTMGEFIRSQGTVLAETQT